MKTALLLAASLGLSLCLLACSDEGRTIRTLQQSGFTEITTTGYEPFSCGRDDDFSTGFKAKNPSGAVVTGVVCCGLMKGCTVRF
jgi:hypothetical protein